MEDKVKEQKTVLIHGAIFLIVFCAFFYLSASAKGACGQGGIYNLSCQQNSPGCYAGEGVWSYYQVGAAYARWEVTYRDPTTGVQEVYYTSYTVTGKFAATLAGSYYFTLYARDASGNDCSGSGSFKVYGGSIPLSSTGAPKDNKKTVYSSPG